MFSRTFCTTSLIAALCGCAQAPQSYTFAASGPRDGAINAVAVTLKKQGIEPGVIDYRAGTITSRWFDTGYRFREIDDNRPLNFYTDIFLRHHISVSESSGTLNVAVKTDIQRCAPLDAVITTTDVEGSCQPMDFLFPTQQREIERLGKQLQEAVSALHQRS